MIEPEFVPRFPGAERPKKGAYRPGVKAIDEHKLVRDKLHKRRTKQDSMPAPEEVPQKKRVIVMLGARMEPTNESGERKFPLFVESQTNVGTALPGEVSGGWARMRGVQAASEREKSLGKDVLVLTTGGNEKSGESRAEGGAEELVERYGFSKDSVIPLAGAGSTLGNARGAAEYIAAHRESLGTVREIEIATNDYHMLRAWIMFSIAMLQVTAHKEFHISERDKKEVQKLLTRGLAATWEEYPSAMKTIREKTMTILEPYFSESKVWVKPLVVEEVLEETGDVAKEKYADLLRDNNMVRATLVYEYGGIMDLLNGKYRVR